MTFFEYFYFIVKFLNSYFLGTTDDLWFFLSEKSGNCWTKLKDCARLSFSLSQFLFDWLCKTSFDLLFYFNFEQNFKQMQMFIYWYKQTSNRKKSSSFLSISSAISVSCGDAVKTWNSRWFALRVKLDSAHRVRLHSFNVSVIDRSRNSELDTSVLKIGRDEIGYRRFTTMSWRQ